MDYGGFLGVQWLSRARSEKPAQRVTVTPAPEVSPCQPGSVTQFFPPGPHDADILTAITAISGDDVWAVGEQINGARVDPGGQLALIEHWDGRSWTIVERADTGDGNSLLLGVSGTSANDIWAVGRIEATNSVATGPEAPLIEHWDGLSWTIVPSPQPTDHEPDGAIGLTAVAALAPDDAWAVGSYSIFAEGVASANRTLIEHWDGGSWTLVASPNVDDQSWLTGISAVFSSDVWAVGYSGVGFGELSKVRPLVLHWDGRSWSIVHGATLGDEERFLYLTSVAALSADDVWIAANKGDGILALLHWDGSGLATVDISIQVRALAARSAHDVWAVGSGMAHWDGTTWKEIAIEPPLPEESVFTAVGEPRSGDVWAAGGLGGPSGNLGYSNAREDPFAIHRCAD